MLGRFRWLLTVGTSVPKNRYFPSFQAVINRRPIAKFIGQCTPWNTSFGHVYNGFNEHWVILIWGSSRFRLYGSENGLHLVPHGIGYTTLAKLFLNFSRRWCFLERPNNTNLVNLVLAVI